MAKRYAIDELERIAKEFSALFEDSEYAYIIVENSVALRKTILNAMAKAGYDNIVEAKDGMDAIMAARKVEGKIVFISELNLPVMDGLQMITQIKKDDKLKDSPVIFMSAETKKDRIIGAIKSGAAAYLKKPFDPSVVIEKLNSLGFA
ncbi:MAG: response regulator [Planctomycetes bacterium]|nr:response regulator [Planctomycetota bacterium]